jgi:protocatechuate 3,4-dioxygenase beta subunit
MKNDIVHCRFLKAYLLASLCLILVSFLQARTTQPTNDKSPVDSPRFTRPPSGDEPTEIKTAIDKAAAALRSRKSASDILSDPTCMPAHEWPRFRKLIREFPADGKLTVVTGQEPGIALTVSARVIDKNGAPVPVAEVYVYQTSAKGWYSDRAAHIQANEGDRKHARLFGYVKTDLDGKFELRTIRPAGYPDSNLPCHIHVEVRPAQAEFAKVISEILFDDDPRLAGPARERATREGGVVGQVRRDGANAQHIDVGLKMIE